MSPKVRSNVWLSVLAVIIVATILSVDSAYDMRSSPLIGRHMVALAWLCVGSYAAKVSYLMLFGARKTSEQ